MISEKDVQAYRRDGGIVVPEVLGADTLAQLRERYAEQDLEEIFVKVMAPLQAKTEAVTV